MDCMASRYPFFFNAASFFPSPLFQEPSFPRPPLPPLVFLLVFPANLGFLLSPTDRCPHRR